MLDRIEISKIEQPLEIDGGMNFHIKHVEVFAGDDDYNITDNILIEQKDGKLNLKSIFEQKTPSYGLRLRGEPGVKLVIMEEGSNSIFEIIIGHHKGSIYISAERTNKYNEPDNFI